MEDLSRLEELISNAVNATLFERPADPLRSLARALQHPGPNPALAKPDACARWMCEQPDSRESEMLALLEATLAPCITEALAADNLPTTDAVAQALAVQLLEQADAAEAVMAGLPEPVRAALQGSSADSAAALMHAAVGGHTDAVALLLKRGAAATDSVCVAAAEQGQADALALLIEQGGRVEASDAQGWTLLMHACATGRGEMADMLLAHGAAIDARTGDGWNPLMFACADGHREVAEHSIA